MSLNHIELMNGFRRGRWWEDETISAISTEKLNPGARIALNTTELTQDYAATARFANEFLGFTYQMKHTWAIGSQVWFHIHWFQNANNTPNWMIEYRTILQGAAASGWTAVANIGNHYTYTAGTILQKTEFALITPAVGMSSFIDIKLYRDSANASGLFGGADPYAGDAAMKQADIHFQKDSIGSITEEGKWGG